MTAPIVTHGKRRGRSIYKESELSADSREWKPKVVGQLWEREAERSARSRAGHVVVMPLPERNDMAAMAAVVAWIAP